MLNSLSNTYNPNNAYSADCRKEDDMTKQNLKNQKLHLLYARLSKDDGEDSTSLSIKNQRQLLTEYAEKNGLTPYRFIEDDGFSGTRWNRPGWIEVMEEIEAGRVATIIIKNLDRMGRDHLRVGLHLEEFENRGIRLIAIHDNIDTANGEDDFTPLRALFAEWHARDTSKKIRAVFKSRMEQGYHVSGSIPYGYIHNPENRQEWLLDEEAAKTIRRIFQLVIEGNGVYQIARILEREKVLIPSAHPEKVGTHNNGRAYADPYMWRGGSVSGILEREEYMGNKILRKGYSDSYKQKKRKATPKDERIIFEGAIPQIIDPETWHTAQRLRRTVRRPAKNGEPPYRLTGLMYCADCNSKMTHDRSQDYRNIRNPRHKNDYLCSNYRQRSRACTMHFIRVPAVEELILDTIKRVSYYVRNNEAEFIAKLREVSATQQENAIKEIKKTLSKKKRRRDELDTLIKKLCEQFALSKIPEKHFDKMMTDYDGEQTSLEESIPQLQSEIDTWGADIEKTDKFIELVHRYTDFSKLSNEMVNSFIEKIVVHEADRSTGKRKQRVDIHLNFIGNFVPPKIIIPPTAEEIAKAQAEKEEAEKLAIEKRERALARQKEKNRAYRQKMRESPNWAEYRAKESAKQKAKYAQRRIAEYEQAIAEGRTPPQPYNPCKKRSTAV